MLLQKCALLLLARCTAPRCKSVHAPNGLESSQVKTSEAVAGERPQHPHAGTVGTREADCLWSIWSMIAAGIKVTTFTWLVLHAESLWLCADRAADEAMPHTLKSAAGLLSAVDTHPEDAYSATRRMPEAREFDLFARVS